jgi:hypothetical protein
MKNQGAGKGDAYRPVNWKQYSENYDRIFKKGNNERTTSISTDGHLGRSSGLVEDERTRRKGLRG